MSIPQLTVSAHSSASLIRSDSIFLSKRITLSGDDITGIGLSVTGTSDESIKTLGGVDIAGKILIGSTLNVDFGPTGIPDASLVTNGGAYIEEDLFVGGNINALSVDTGTTGELISEIFYFKKKDEEGYWRIIQNDSNQRLIFQKHLGVSGYVTRMQLT